jgi:hypothetical protein
VVVVGRIDQLGRTRPDQRRRAQVARRRSGWRVEAEAPSIGDGAATVTKASPAGLGAKLDLHLAAGVLDTAAHRARDVTDLCGHGGAEIAASDGGDESHGSGVDCWSPKEGEAAIWGGSAQNLHKKSHDTTGYWP